MSHTWKRVTFLSVAILLATTPGTARGSAQSLLLDQGTFRVSLEGRDAGTETFMIERTGTGPDALIVARGDVELEGRRVSTLLEATAGAGFGAYRAEVTGDEMSEVVVTRRQRLGVWVRSPAGIQDREFRWREGSVLLDDLVAHLYYFIGMVAPGTAAPVILPRGSDQASLRVVAVAPDVLAFEGGDVEARRLSLTVDGQERLVWIDALGRVLRVEVPSIGYVAERLTPPPASTRDR